MSLPDIDYELSILGQFEYSVGLAKASTSQDMEFVAKAFRAGQEKMVTSLKAKANKDGYVTITIFELEKMLEK